MTDTTNTLQQAHKELWEFRNELESVWPTPFYESSPWGE